MFSDPTPSTALQTVPDWSFALVSFKAMFSDIGEFPCWSGTSPLDRTTSKLFYQGPDGDKTGLVDFANASDEQLAALAAACQPASFGRNREDVVDESYRKAGKMDTTNFATLFSPVTSGIIDKIHSQLMQGQSILEKDIKVELYKLNVYGPGSFFKAHVDTPRSDTMLGSLVVVFPTVHEGGSLIFRHRGQEKIVDTAKLVSSAPQDAPLVAFTAFFSDVEHEVSVVTSGYRVTLTYNLYLVDRVLPAVPPGLGFGSPDPLKEMKSRLSVLLSYPSFMPNGGLLGFQLSHRYPFSPLKTKLSELEDRLKGSDVFIKKACEEMSLPVSLKAKYSYHSTENGVEVFALAPEFADMNYLEYECKDFDGLWTSRDAWIAYPYLLAVVEETSFPYSYLPIVWIGSGRGSNSFEAAYISYGNQPTVDHLYAEVCLVAKVDTFAKRSVV